jgi:hypothetical protein
LIEFTIVNYSGFLPIVSVEPGLTARKPFQEVEEEQLLLEEGVGTTSNTTITNNNNNHLISSTTAEHNTVPTFTITPLGKAFLFLLILRNYHR